MDKVVSKQIFVSAGLKTPAWETVRAGEDVPLEEISLRLGDKVVVKPVSEGSSVGMSIVHESNELGPAVARALEHDRTVLIEQFVAGAEVTVGVLGNEELEPLPTLEIVPEHEFYDYESKYIPGMSRHIIPRAWMKKRGRSASGSLSRRTARCDAGGCHAPTPSSPRGARCTCWRSIPSPA